MENQSVTQSVSYSNHSIQVRFGADESNVSANLYTGYISNARIVSGEALYTTNYTVPIHAFDLQREQIYFVSIMQIQQQHQNMDAQVETSPTLTVTGDAAASSVSPITFTRDFTFALRIQGCHNI